MASTGSGDSLFSLPSTAHFGQRSPPLEDIVEVAGIVAAPARMDPTGPGNLSGSADAATIPQDVPTSGTPHESVTCKLRLPHHGFLSKFAEAEQCAPVVGQLRADSWTPKNYVIASRRPGRREDGPQWTP